MDINCVALSGRLAADPRSATTATGQQVAEFNLAINRRHGDDEEVSYIPVVCFGRLADAVSQYLSRGRGVAVSGRLYMERWTDREGKARNTLKVVAQDVAFLEVPSEPRPMRQGGQQGLNPPSQGTGWGQPQARRQMVPPPMQPPAPAPAPSDGGDPMGDLPF